jgi:hypothetical protein
MTTAAAMLAGVPLALGAGLGSERRQPLGYAMVGGLALSQLLTLYTTLLVYLYLDRLRRRLRGPTQGAAPDHERLKGAPPNRLGMITLWFQQYRPQRTDTARVPGCNTADRPNPTLAFGSVAHCRFHRNLNLP